MIIITEFGKIQDKAYSNSAIDEHFWDNYEFENYDLNKFTILSKSGNKFHLKAIYILSKNPELCKQKKVVYSAILFSKLNFLFYAWVNIYFLFIYFYLVNSVLHTLLQYG